MPLTTFTPPVRPSAGTGITSEVSLRQAPFGDGYTQASPAGLNHIRKVVSFKWDYLSLAEAMAIDAFLKARGGYEPFYYRLNGETTDRKMDLFRMVDHGRAPDPVDRDLSREFHYGSLSPFGAPSRDRSTRRCVTLLAVFKKYLSKYIS